MRNFVFIIIITFTLCLCGCFHTQTNESEKQTIEMLIEFYTAYNATWTIKPPLDIKVRHNKLDSLMVKYCTVSVRSKAKEQLEYGFDLLTSNLGSVDSNENLKVEKDLSKDNVYIVSFIATNSDASGRPVKQNVLLHITVVKENENYLISNVE